MGSGELKRGIREKIITYQYHMDGDDIWELLDTYDRYLEDEHTADELAEAAFMRGDVAFHTGRYQDTVKALTKSLGIEKTPEYVYLEADAYNMLGMLFSFAGYESIALDNYLSAVESAKKIGYIYGEVSALLNIGLLYQELSDYRKAMMYYKKGSEVASSDHSSPEMMLVMLCLIQEAQLLFRMQKYEEAERLKREIDSYYQVIADDELLVSKCILEAWLATHSGAEAEFKKCTEEIRQYLVRDEHYLEQIDFYVEFCAFLMESGRKEETRQFLDILMEKLGATEFLHLRIRMEEMEVAYQEKYGDVENYRKACMNYMILQQECEHTLQEFRQQNLSNAENLQELEKQRQEFEFRSKCDLATGLLNKDTFRYEVEHYLEERNRNVVDALVMIDIDDFKLINDSFGHLVGDEVIAALAGLMKKEFHEDICGRFGGDEFEIFIRGIEDMGQVELRVETLREEFGCMRFGRNGHVQSTVSIGVSYNHGVNASYKTMFACADEALLKAKEYGKNRVAFFEIKRGLLKYV